MRIRPITAGDAPAIAALSGELGYETEAGAMAVRLGAVLAACAGVWIVRRPDLAWLWLAFGLNFNFLTLVVSFEAILLMNILLMAQNRQARGDELRDEADYQADKHSADKMDELIELFKKSK